MPDDNPKTVNPPYVAFQSFKNFIEGLKATGIPGRIDKSVMSTMSGATQSSLLLTLRFLQLIDESGAPSSELKKLVEGPEADSRMAYAALVTQRYAFVPESRVNLESATQDQLEEVFEARGLSGDTLRKAVSFYVLLATEGGLKISQHRNFPSMAFRLYPRLAHARTLLFTGAGCVAPGHGAVDRFILARKVMVRDQSSFDTRDA